MPFLPVQEDQAMGILADPFGVHRWQFHDHHGRKVWSALFPGCQQRELEYVADTHDIVLLHSRGERTAETRQQTADLAKAVVQKRLSPPAQTV